MSKDSLKSEDVVKLIKDNLYLEVDKSVGNFTDTQYIDIRLFWDRELISEDTIGIR